MNLIEQKKFGILFFIIFLSLSLYFYFYSSINFAIFFFILSFLFFIFSIYFPFFLVLPYKLWINFSLFLNKIISPLVIFLQYFVLFGITSLIVRAFKGDLINQKINKEKNTYWTQKSKYTYEERLDDQF